MSAPGKQPESYVIWKCPRCQHEKRTGAGRFMLRGACEQRGCPGVYRIYKVCPERRKVGE